MTATSTVTLTLMKNLTELKDIHAGKDIYILGAGASLDHIDKSFFDGKICIGINRVGKFYECDYIMTKDSRGFDSILKGTLGTPKILLSKYETGDPGRGLNSMEGDVYIYDHFSKPRQMPMVDEISKKVDKLVVSFSTITTGIHAAAYMGAKNIIICGHDCGALDGKTALKGYHEDLRPHHGSAEAYATWLGMIEDHTVSVKKKLQSEYGCNIMSLNPFINFNLEGHKYARSSNIVIPVNTTKFRKR